MALNDIGVNLIQVESNTAPTVEPVEIGVLGIHGRLYRGKRLTIIRGGGVDAITQVAERFGTPYENFRNPTYYNIVGHILNTTTFGSSLVVSRAKGNNARTARTYNDPNNINYGDNDPFKNGNYSIYVMRLLRINADYFAKFTDTNGQRRIVEPLIKHSYDSSKKTYRFEIKVNLSLDVNENDTANYFTSLNIQIPDGSISCELTEIYIDSSLSRIANAINNGDRVDSKEVLLVFMLGTSRERYNISSIKLNSPSDICFVDIVTQALEIPIFTNSNYSSFDQGYYNVPLCDPDVANPNSNNPDFLISKYFYQAAQDDEEDWGNWGNLLSIVVDKSDQGPIYRKVDIYYKREGKKVLVESYEDTENGIISLLKSSKYVRLLLHSRNVYNFLPFTPGLELNFYGGQDGTLNYSSLKGDPLQSTGAYAFLGTPATSICCPDVTSDVTMTDASLSENAIVEIIDTYATVALTTNKTALFTLPRNISRDKIFSVYTKNFLKERSNLVLYRANGAVADGRGGRINVSLVGFIHGAAYVRWRLSQSIFPNIPPKGDSTFLIGVFSLDKERYSQAELTDYIKNLGINPVALTPAGFIIEGARTMSRKNVHYSVHTTELTNFYVESVVRFASFLKSEFNDETAQNRFAQRLTDFTRILYDSRCLETEGGFQNNFQVKVDNSINPIQSRRKRIFNARIKIRWIEQIESINIFFEKTDEGINAGVE